MLLANDTSLAWKSLNESRAQQASRRLSRGRGIATLLPAGFCTRERSKFKANACLMKLHALLYSSSEYSVFAFWCVHVSALAAFACKVFSCMLLL